MTQLTAADVQELLAETAIENVRLEFKSQAPNKDETLKKLSSFGNTFGGFLVVGAKANSADGRIESLPGVDAQPGYKQRLVQWCFEGTSPPLNIEVSDEISVPGANGKVCYVVHVPESDVAPHFLNGGKGIWVRTDEYSSRFEAQLADESHLRQLFDRRKYVLDRRSKLLERARERFDTYSARPQEYPLGVVTKSSRLEFSVVPRFPARPICQQDSLNSIIVGNTLQWRGISFPRIGQGIVSQYESAIVLRPARLLSILEVNVWGLLFYGARIDGDHGGHQGIHLYEFVGTVLLSIRYAAMSLKALGYSGPILIQIALTSIRGIKWLYADQGMLVGMPSSKDGSELDDEVAFEITSTTAALENPDRIAADVLRTVFFAVNWPDLVEEQNLTVQIRNGYSFNNWPQPQKLNI